MVRVIAWGKTGRVRVDRSREGTYNDVYIDTPTGRAGMVDKPYGKGLWRAITWALPAGRYEAHFESFDAAVMWVLRRVDPKLWREERGAWLVRKRRPGEGVQRGWIDGEAHGYNDFWPWLVVDPSGVSVDATSDIPRAHYYANLYASETAT